jgi:hypothetical protein
VTNRDEKTFYEDRVFIRAVPEQKPFGRGGESDGGSLRGGVRAILSTEGLRLRGETRLLGVGRP